MVIGGIRMMLGDLIVIDELAGYSSDDHGSVCRCDGPLQRR
jgi:hypothetical protein